MTDSVQFRPLLINAGRDEREETGGGEGCVWLSGCCGFSPILCLRDTFFFSNKKPGKKGTDYDYK